MNDTTRDALVEKVTGILDARSQLTATELSHRDICQDANELVEAVTRHRDAEIRELLLSDGAKDAVATFLIENSAEMSLLMAAVNKGEMNLPGIGQDVLGYTIEDWLTAALDHIGLGDGTGGQG